MRIESLANTDTIVSQNNREQVEDTGKARQEKQSQVENGSLKASELNLCQDSIAQKKKKAMEEAMGFIKKQFESDMEVDDVLEECRTEIDAAKESAREAAGELGEIRKQKEQMKENGLDEDSEEYQQQIKELSERAEYWQKQYDDSHVVIAAATKGIKAIKQEALKHHGMVDAANAAEETMQAASKEVVGMLVQESVDKVDEDLEEVVEKAEETKEENAEKEAEREEIQAEREKQAQEVEEELQKQKKAAENRRKPSQMPDMDEILQKQQDIVKNTQQILEEQKLLEEEIKGIVVDSLL